MTDLSNTLEFKIGEILGNSLIGTCREITPLLEGYQSELKAWKERADKFERQIAYQQQTIDFLNACVNKDEEAQKQILGLALEDDYWTD